MAALIGAAPMRDDIIKRLREILPPLLTVQQYCRVMNRCQASAYSDLRNIPGLAVKVGGSTRIVRDVMLDAMARLPEWIPQKDRVGAASASPAAKITRKSTRPNKQTAATRRERNHEVRA
jgi:hypothetical protein